MTYKRVYRFCDGEIVDGLNRRRYNPKKEDDMQCICTIINALINQVNETHEKNKELSEENEHLKTVINRYEKYFNKKNDELTFRQLDILKLKEENEQLKQFQSKVFDLIDEKIEYNEKKLQFARGEGFIELDNLSYAINTLKELKKELKE